MPDVFSIAQEFRRRLAAREPEAMRRLARAYEPVARAIDAALERLRAGLESASARGAQRRRLETLKAEIEAAMRALLPAVGVIAAEQRNALALAEEYAATLSLTAFRLPSEAFEFLVGFLGDGSPLQARIARMGAEAAEIAEDALTVGIAQGLPPDRIAAFARRRIRGTAANDETPRTLRALATIARTETQRAFSQANLLLYRQNGIERYRWLSSRQPGRTCAACWALDGRIFSSAAPMPKHVNCRCVAVPVLEGVEQSPSGPQIFAGLSPGEQDATLGRAGGLAYRDGKLSLDALVRESNSPQWGRSLAAGSLRDALGEAALRRYERQAAGRVKI
jgi:SPP1 gp7 family putative phage head morphogenesis protein